MLDNLCWGHGHRRKGFMVACIATVEGLGPGENWHVHLTLCAPRHVDFKRFFELIAKAVAKVPSFGSQVQTDPYDGPEWLDYCFKNGSDCWLVDCTRTAKP